MQLMQPSQAAAKRAGKGRDDGLTAVKTQAASTSAPPTISFHGFWRGGLVWETIRSDAEAAAAKRGRSGCCWTTVAERATTKRVEKDALMAVNAEPEQGGAAALIRDAPFNVVMGIIRRLTPTSFFRFRAVCRDWRDATSYPGFLAVLHLIQTPRPLLCFGASACPDRYIQLRDYCVEALDLRSDKLHSIFRYTDNMYCHEDKFVDGYEVAPINDFAVDYARYDQNDDDERFVPRLTIHASVDGLLLVSLINIWYVCNPATRKCASVVDLGDFNVIGFYEHASSSEYRVLLHTGKEDGDVVLYLVYTVNPMSIRFLGCPIAPAVENMGLHLGLDPSSVSPPVYLRRKLYWPPQQRQGYHILVFNTEAEVFSWMIPPVTDKDMRLLEIDGRLAMSVSRMNRTEVELWRMQDNENEIWFRVFRIQLAVAQITDLCFGNWSPSVVSREGDVLIECPNRVLHCDRNGTLLHKFWFPDVGVSSRHVLRESLLWHPIFRVPEGQVAAKTPFYAGL